MNRRLLRFLSRISIRLMLFNLLLVFLPVAGIVYLGSYEAKLLAAQRRALDEEARLMSAALTATGNPAEMARPIISSRAQLPSPGGLEPVRLRVVSPDGSVLADSGAFRQPARGTSEARRTVLYQIGAALLKPVLRVFQATEPALTLGDYYERREHLLGDEIVAGIDLKTDRAAGKVLIQAWHWFGSGRARSHKKPIEEALHRFERFQLGD